jgi:hypothetical protein
MPNRNFGNTNEIKKIYAAIVVLAVVIVLGYSLFEGRLLLAGPELAILSPRDGSATSTSGVVIEGTARNISFLTINDQPAYTDQSGHFSETLSPPAGYTVFTVAAVDRFGRRASISTHFTVLDYCPVS